MSRVAVLQRLASCISPVQETMNDDRENAGVLRLARERDLGGTWNRNGPSPSQERSPGTPGRRSTRNHGNVRVRAQEDSVTNRAAMTPAKSFWSL
jgi:hypothetical protein